MGDEPWEAKYGRDDKEERGKVMDRNGSACRRSGIVPIRG